MVYYFYACGCFYSYGALTTNRALLENINILTWLQGFQVKIEILLKVSFVPKPLYQVDAYRAGYQTRDQEF